MLSHGDRVSVWGGGKRSEDGSRWWQQDGMNEQSAPYIWAFEFWTFKDGNVFHQRQAWVKFQSALPLLILTILQLNHLSLPLPPPVSNLTLLASSLYASPCVPAVVLYYGTFQGTYCKIQSLFPLFFVCLLCIIWVKSIKKIYYSSVYSRLLVGYLG